MAHAQWYNNSAAAVGPLDPAHAYGPYTGMDQTILVVDPATRKFSIPLAAVYHTQALNRPDRVPSICMLFLCGRCRQGAMCHQLHADPVLIEQLRSDASLRASCCPDHGEDVVHVSLPAMVPTLSKVVIEGIAMPPGRVATTNGMRRLATEGAESIAAQQQQKAALSIQRSQVCRLHLQGRCRYGEDCNFIHLCRTYINAPENAELHALLNAATPKQQSSRSFRTPTQQYAPGMPPSPLYGGMPTTPIFSTDSLLLPLDAQVDSRDATPPSTPALNDSVRTPVGGQAWRYEPYSWQCVSPVRAQA